MANHEGPSLEDSNNIFDVSSSGKITNNKSYRERFEEGLTPLGRKLFNIASINEKVVERLMKDSDLSPKKTDTFTGNEVGDPASPEELAQRVRILQAENSALKRKNNDLELSTKKLTTELMDSNSDLTLAQDKIKDLESDNKLVRKLNKMLGDKVSEMSTELYGRTQRPDAPDPKGFYKALGIDPTLAVGLSQDVFDTLLTSVYRAYSKVHHPDLGGDTERMKLVNSAYEFLQNPLNRNTYGRS